MITILIVIAVIVISPLLLILAITAFMKSKDFLITTDNKIVYYTARLINAKVNYKGKYYERK